MNKHYSEKSTPKEIRERFDKDVERFSDVNTGQQTTIDAPLCLELITDAAKAINPFSRNLLDVGCGAGNYSLKMISKVPGLNCTLLDLSMPMLLKARERISGQTNGKIEIFQQDIREVELPDEHYDIILAGAVLHHLRENQDWEFVFHKLFKCLKKGGSLWISDLVIQDNVQINTLIWHKYGQYLEKLGGREFQEKVLQYIDKEDSPRSVHYQLNLMKSVGFTQLEILHKNLCFAAFGGIKC